VTRKNKEPLVTTPLNPQGTVPATQPPSEARKTRQKWPWIIGGIVLLLLIVSVSCGNEKSSTPMTTTTTPDTQAPAAPAHVTVPGELVGKNAQLADDELRRLGITNIGYTSQDAGSKVESLLENWIVTKVEPAPGTVVLTTDTVMITATKKHGPVAPVAPSAVSAPAPALPAAPVPSPAAPAPAPADSSPGGPYYRNCAAARAAGVAPLHRGDPGYRAGLDRDGDGVACE
jgi:Excalibur calcium-binding domain